MRVEISAEAERDLHHIANYISRDDVRTAIEFVSTLRAACEGLADFPERFPVVPRYERQGIRHRVVGNYMIFYQVGESE